MRAANAGGRVGPGESSLRKLLRAGPARQSVGGGYYTRLRGQEFTRNGNSVGWRWTIHLVYQAPVSVAPIPPGTARLQAALPSVDTMSQCSRSVAADENPTIEPW